MMKMLLRSGIGFIELIELLKHDAILQTFGLYLSLDRVATITCKYCHPVQL